MIQAIIFDFDGTILETEMPDYLSWQEVYREHQCEIPFDLWLNAVGSSADGFDPYAYLEQQIRRTVDRAELREKRRARLRELVAQQSPRPGVAELITEAKQLGLRLAIASSSGRDWVESNLDIINLRHHFEVVFTREDVARVKPDPALYNLTLNALGVLPEAAIAIEDSRNGMLAAKAAGIKCVVTPNEITRQLTFDEADLCLESLGDCALEELLRRLSIQSKVEQ